jgi:hypothetical protein
LIAAVNVGKLIGRGLCRDVFEHPSNPDLVVKVDHSGNQNAVEWAVWQRVRGTEHADSFAPCVQFEDGYLVMRRCQPCNETLPHDLVVFGVHIKDSARHGNTGMLDGRLVCLDYGHSSAQSLKKS